MRPRISQRILTLRPSRPPSRLFTQNFNARPQLPFLNNPTRRRAVRFLTTERKLYLKEQALLAGKYTTILWTTTALGLIIAFGLQQEYLERKYPSPHDWNWITRKDYRSARWNEEPAEGKIIDWARTGNAYRLLIAKLEDTAKEGADVEVGDISKKSEPWRRGYYDLLMGAARAAEHLDGWVRDKTRNTAFPGNVVIGPSNPDPRPVPPGAASPPREEDCEAAFEDPSVYYNRILTTNGFDERQQLEATLAFANWFDYKGDSESAESLYQRALNIAKDHKDIVEKSGAIKADAGIISANVLKATTALAVHRAVCGDTSSALPIFLSILRARRALPEHVPSMRSTLADNEDDQNGLVKNLWGMVRSVIIAPEYPPPPPSGMDPPTRTSKEKCEESAVMAYIGEILFASGTSGRDNGLAWTREAVDVAEQELRTKKMDKIAKSTCAACLEVGLGNWSKMVSRLSREEKEKKSVPKSSWWGKIEPTEAKGRWESEEEVVKERIKRVRQLFETDNLNTAGGSGTFIFS